MYRRYPAFFIVSLLFFLACGDKPAGTKEETPPTPMERNAPPPQTPDAAEQEGAENGSIEAFWTQLQRDIAKEDAAAVADKIAFPMVGAQYLIGKPGQAGGISRAQFMENFVRVFDRGARNKIISTPYEELEEIPLNKEYYDLSQVQPTGYRLLVHYDTGEETESTLMYMIGKTATGYRIIGVEFAG